MLRSGMIVLASLWLFIVPRLTAATPMPTPGTNWRTAFDLDGDGHPDRIDDRLSGGGHCCYRIAITASRTSIRHELPFEIDGGYVTGLDLNTPAQFAIADFNGDGLPDIRMEIATYDGERVSLPHAWRLHYGVRSHRILVTFRGGHFAIVNLPERR